MSESQSKPRSESRQRNSFLIARCTLEEKALATLRANQKGLLLPDLIRQETIGIKPLSTVRKAGPQAEAILLLKAELNKIGSNINQIAKVANFSKSISQEQVEELIHALAKCYDEITKLSIE
jgi:SMC interacting uncharacterized protein involved in chromosome segregation